MKIPTLLFAILVSLFSCLTLFVATSSVVNAENTNSVELINIDYDYNIQENGDGVYIDVLLASTHDSDVTVKLDFSSSSATLGLDFNVLDATTWSTFTSNNQNIDVIIPAGSLSKKLFIQTIIDYTHEENESIKIEIASVSSNLNFDSNPINTITIDDDDALQSADSITLTNLSDDYNITENGDGVDIAVILSNAQIVDTVVVIDFNSSTATANDDFKIINRSNWQELPIVNGTVSITLPAGVLSQELFIHSVEDDIYEGKEIIEATIVSVTHGINLGSNISENVTIDDNDIQDLFYVSLDGDDLNDGTAEHPFRTITQGVSALNSGDTLIIYPGHYDDKNVSISTSGTVGSPTIIKAETANTVFLEGTRPAGITLSTGVFDNGFIINDTSNIIIDGFNFSNFDVGILIDGDTDNDLNFAKNITIKNSTFKNNAGSGITSWELDNLTVSHSSFISLKPLGGWADPQNPEAIQDYGVAIYHSIDSIVEDSYFYGAHHQALSFKYGNYNGVARRNIFSGNLYTALYLGQGAPSIDKPLSFNLIAEYNIIRNAENYRLKNPITAGNVNGAIIRHNYLEGYGIANNSSIGGVQVFDYAKGKIEIYNNIMAFGKKEVEGQVVYSAGVFLDYNIPPETTVEIHNNVIYNVFQEFMGSYTASHTFDNNTIGMCTDYYFAPPLEEPNFVNGIPLPLPLDTEPTHHDFDEYYNQLVSLFALSL